MFYTGDITPRIIRHEDDGSRRVNILPFPKDWTQQVIVWQRRRKGGTRGWGMVKVLWPGNPSGTPGEAARFAEALAEAARIAAEWHREDTTNQLTTPPKG